MNASEHLEGYLNRFRLRLTQLNLARGIALVTITSLVITLIAVTIAIRQGFPDGFMLTARLALLASIVGLSLWLIVRPNRRIREHGIDDIEAQAPAFDGRLNTYAEMSTDGSPFRELLAEDATKIADEHAPEQQLPQKAFTLPVAGAVTAVAALLLLGIAGPGNYGYGVRDLWLGWAIPGIVPPQSITVTPGDSGIRAGGTLRVRAETAGFSPAEAFVHARFGNEEWQQVSMAGRDEGFEFTFFSVREPLEYYVSAAGIRSPAYRVEVVDLPAIERLTNVYRWPQWTGRDEQTVDPGGDIRAVADTSIDVIIETSEAMPPGVLVVDDTEIPLDVDATTGNATFTVEEDGEYHIAAVVGGERIRLTDDFFITVAEDEPPSIEFAKPGRDWSASAIEEVTTVVSTTDDFRVESLEVNYSVNGGEWVAVDLDVGEAENESEHVFMLESLMEGMPAGELSPGDLVSYYAVATDRSNSARTDIFFIDVQRFDRRYSQSQMAGGGGGGGQQQDEISKRQREIIVSTWNLIREQSEEREDAMYVPDNAALLSRLQRTLRDQAMTLAQRTRARMLTASDPKIAEFVENLELAAEAMVPAAEQLADIDLNAAILPEQEALQHLLRAEAVFNEINVNMANNGGGGGGSAGRDLSDMFELEMDLEKNQYETGSQATPDAPQEALEEIGDELEELARRQEQLANRMNADRQPTPAQRWQQDMLRREAEQLQERLERMQQQAANSQASQSQSGSQSQGAAGEAQSANNQPSDGQPGQAGETGPMDRTERRMDELRRRMDRAVQAMNDADQAMRQGADAEASQAAAAEAQRQLESARDQAAAERDRLLQGDLNELGERANEVYRAQAGMEERLQRAIRDMLSDDDNEDRMDSGLSFREEMQMAAAKRELQSELQRLEVDARAMADRLTDERTRAAAEIDNALDELGDDETAARLSVAADYIEIGEAVYVSGSESGVTQSLRDFADALTRAGRMVAENDPNGQPGQGEPGLAEALAEVRSLRQQLEALGGNAQLAERPTATGRDDLQRSSGQFVPDVDVTQQLDRDLDGLSDVVFDQFRELRESGVPARTIDEIRRLAASVRASDFSGNEALLEREADAALGLVEQLELMLARAARAQTTAVRSTPAEPVPDEHRKPVADYFRRLGESGTDQE